MVQKILTKYWLMLHITILLLATWGTSLYLNAGWIFFSFWLSFFAVQAFLLLPSVFRGETMSMARRRSLWGAVCDPFLSIGLALTGFTCLQWLNSGCSLIYVEDVEVWRYSSPPVSWLPFSIDPFPALAGMVLIVVIIVGGFVLRSGTGKRSNRLFLDIASFASGCFAIYMLLLGVLGIQPFSECGASAGDSNWGAFFGFWMLVALGGHLNFIEESFAKTLSWSFFSLLGNLLGLLQFGTPAGIALFAIATLAIFAYWTFFLVRQQTDSIMQLKLIFCVLIAIIIAGTSFGYVLTESFVMTKMEMLFDSSYYESLFNNRNFQAPLAWRIWQDHPWIGVGTGGFLHYSQTIVGDIDWMRLNESKGLISNDWLQFLTEYGLIGSGLLLSLVIVLLIPLFSRFRFVIQQLAKKKQEVLIDVNPYVMSGVFASILVVLSSFLSSPLQSGAMFASLVYVLAVVPGFIPVSASNTSQT